MPFVSCPHTWPRTNATSHAATWTRPTLSKGFVWPRIPRDLWRTSYLAAYLYIYNICSISWYCIIRLWLLWFVYCTHTYVPYIHIQLSISIYLSIYLPIYIYIYIYCISIYKNSTMWHICMWQLCARMFLSYLRSWPAGTAHKLLRDHLRRWFSSTTRSSKSSEFCKDMHRLTM